MSSPRSQKPLELILARNLLTSISTPAFLLDADAAVVFYNEAAAAVLGRSFEDAGRMSAEQWTETFGPFGKDGAPLDVDGMATTEAIRAGRPAHGTFTIRAANGERISIEVPKTIADGAQTQSLGRITFEIIRRDVDDVLTAGDAELVEAMRFFAERMKMIVEPTGCLGFAAARRMNGELAGKRVGVIISGGNVDLARFAALTGH